MAQESLGGTYIKQLGNGPAHGVYQMEEATYIDIWRTFLSRNQNLAMKILAKNSYTVMPRANIMDYNLYFATMMCRVFYLRCNDQIPDSKDLNAVWAYYKKNYNTEKGAATKEQFFRNYEAFTGREQDVGQTQSAVGE